MSVTPDLDVDVSSIAERRAFVAALQEEAASRIQANQSGIEICEWFSDQLDLLLIKMVQHQLAGVPNLKSHRFALICVGGNGRRRPAPYSDLDLLIVADSKSVATLSPYLSAFVRDCWDSGFQLGHSIRTPDDVVRFAIEDIQFATSLVDMRFLTGAKDLYDQLSLSVKRRVFSDGPGGFVERCVRSRREEWVARGDSVNQLEPDIKRSPGGLRDLHLLRWVSFARYGDSDPSTLLEHGELRTRELAVLARADEFLTTLRVNLHCHARLKQDVLTRELQLEMANGHVSSSRHARRAVEVFMQEYFRQTSHVAEIARRIAEEERSPSLLKRLRNAILPSRLPKGYIVENGSISLEPEQLKVIQSDQVALMDVFVFAANEKLRLAPNLRKSIGKIVLRMPRQVSRNAARRLRWVLRSDEGMPGTLRAMHETGVLEWLIPEFAEIRCLMQFNQYHSFTVDEHTLKTIDEVVALKDDESPVGTAYRSVRHKATLHLSLLMHDIGKGREGDHSRIGAEICEGVARRLQMAENKKQMMKFLVRYHLVMPDLALRRDITDPSLLTEFARLVGSPEHLRMLYVLSVADIKAVGPDTWTDWKGELLAELYSRTMEIVSGRPFNHLEQENLRLIRQHVRQALTPASGTAAQEPDEPNLPDWVDQQLDALPPFYLMTEAPERIARDLDAIRQLDQSEVRIEGAYDAETDTVCYRIFASARLEKGSFHKISGILSGMRMDIHAAQTCTSSGGMLVACFHVSDNDFTGRVPPERIKEVTQAIVDVLTGKLTVDSVFRRSSVFRLKKTGQPLVRHPPQVSIDNDCSENHTVIDVFAMDSPGLLYTLALTLYEHGLSVELTRIATRIDQIVDVFYVVDSEGRKVLSKEKLDALRESLMEELMKLQDT